MNKMTRTPEREPPMLSFGSFVTRRILIPSERTNLVAVDKFFLVSLMKRKVERIHFDEGWYLSKYPDIRQAVEAGKIPSARHHYVADGFYEHRLPYEIIVDAGWYLKQYPDVKAAVDGKQYESAQMHFELSGYREGREPFAEFALACSSPLPG